MSRQSEWIRDDWVRRDSFKRLDLTRTILKGCLRDAYTSVYKKQPMSTWLGRSTSHFSVTAQRNKCRITGRSYFVLARAGLARMPFRFAAGCGLLNGISRRGK